MNDYQKVIIGHGEEEIVIKLLDAPIEKNAVGIVECNSDISSFLQMPVNNHENPR